MSHALGVCVCVCLTAMNGHQECLRLLMSHSQHLDVDAEDINGQ